MLGLTDDRQQVKTSDIRLYGGPNVAHSAGSPAFDSTFQTRGLHFVHGYFCRQVVAGGVNWVYDDTFPVV